MSLGNEQRRFTLCVAKLIIWAYDNGYEITLGDAYRDPRLHGHIGFKEGYGHARSNHKQRLAIDLNLFKDGEYLASTAAHRPLGEFWETLDDKASWGGFYNDGNHYSYKYGGMR